jgi:hypothetical protein
MFTEFSIWDFCFIVLRLVQSLRYFLPREKPAVVIGSVGREM